MRHLLAMLLLLFSIAVNAQETAKIRVTYELDNLSNNKKFRAKNAWALDIGDTTAIFYTPNERNAVPLIDSIKKRITEDMRLFIAKRKEILDKYPGGYPMQVLRGLPQAGMNTCLRDDCGQQYMLYECKDPMVDWEMEDSVKTVCGYACQKAVGKLYGRTWTVWFAEDFALSYGPFVLGGLPGMILEAYDADNIYHYTAIGIERLENGPAIKLFKEYYKVVECSREQYLKARENFKNMTNEEYLKRAGITTQGSPARKVTSGKAMGNTSRERFYLDLE